MLIYDEIVQAVDEFNGDEYEVYKCFSDCEEQGRGRCTLLAYSVTRSLYDMHCSPSDSDELAELEAVLLSGHPFPPPCRRESRTEP